MPCDAHTSPVITLPSAESDLLMAHASRSRALRACVCFCRSEPARSTRLSVEVVTSCTVDEMHAAASPAPLGARWRMPPPTPAASSGRSRLRPASSRSTSAATNVDFDAAESPRQYEPRGPYDRFKPLMPFKLL
eukprot:6187310-Pleurochrysis_carterae.AAC.1